MFSVSRKGFTLLGLDIRWYGVLIAMGVLLGVLWGDGGRSGSASERTPRWM